MANYRIQLLDAKNISAYHLLYLAVKYNPDPELLKAIAKDMLKIAKNQPLCSTNIKYFKEQFIKAFTIAKEAMPDNDFLKELYRLNLIEAYTKTFMDDYLRYADSPDIENLKSYRNWDPYIMPKGSLYEREIIKAMNQYVGFNDVNRKSNLIQFKSIIEQYLTKFEGIAIPLLYKAYEMKNGEAPKNRADLELWSEETFPVDRFTNQPYEINNDSEIKLFSVGPDFKPSTKDDIRFW